MSQATMHEIVRTICLAGRITAADVARMQREILPDGITARAEVEALIGLDAVAPDADPAFAAWLVPAVVDFVVWGERPTGRVEEDTGRWLAGLLSATPTPTGRALAREIAREAVSVPAALAALGGGSLADAA